MAADGGCGQSALGAGLLLAFATLGGITVGLWVFAGLGPILPCLVGPLMCRPKGPVIREVPVSD